MLERFSPMLERFSGGLQPLNDLTIVHPAPLTNPKLPVTIAPNKIPSNTPFPVGLSENSKIAPTMRAKIGNNFEGTP